MSLRVCALALAATGPIAAQGRPLDWPFFGGDAQRSGWQKSDLRITKDNVKDFQLVLKRKLEANGGAMSLTPPVVIGNLISYKGFKELGFVQGSSGELWAVDLDINRMFWHKQLASSTRGCSGGAMATPTLTPPLDFSAARTRPATPAPSASPGIPPSPAATPAAAPKPSILGSTAFGAPRPAFALSKDGKLHVLNTSTGDDLIPPIPFVPENSRASTLGISDNTIYTSTTDCSGKNGAVWAIDLGNDDRKVEKFEMTGVTPAGVAGVAMGRSYNVYVAGTDGSLTALAPKTLKQIAKWNGGAQGSVQATPVVFAMGDTELVVAADAEGRLNVFESDKLNAPLYKTQPIGVVSGGMSTWQDTAGDRWIAVPVVNGSKGSIMAFKLEATVASLKLTQAWTSPEMESPEPPVITSGIVFALAAGGKHATLYALDGATGQQMYSSENQVTAPANRNGMTVANGRVFFTTTDGTLYGFGIFMETLEEPKSQSESRSNR